MPKRKNLIFKLLIGAALIFFLAVNSGTVANSIRVKLSDLSALPLRAINSAFKFTKKMIPFAGLREENRLLRERIELLNRRLEESKLLGSENRRMKEILGFKSGLPYETIPAEVIGRDPSNWSNSLILGKGAAQGIRSGKAVISMSGLVGRVLEVGRNSSRVLLITDPNSKVGAVIQRTRQGGILVGRPDGMCKLIYLALDSDVTKGDIVITAGFGGAFPGGILIGEVLEVGKEPGRLYKFAIVRPAQDMTKLEEVLCIR